MFTKKNYQIILNHFKTIDPTIHNLMLKHGYLKPFNNPKYNSKRDLFSILIGVIIGQKIKFSLAQNLRAQLYTLLKTNNFTPEDLLNLDRDILLERGFSLNIVNLIYKLANDINKGEIILNTPSDIKNLEKIKGIGPWTINTTILMYSLCNDDNNFSDVVLYEDLIIRRGIKDMYGKTIKSEVIELSKKWIPYRGVVMWYIWKEYT